LANQAMREFVDNVIDLAHLGVFEADMVKMQRVVNKHTRHMLGIHDRDVPDFQPFSLEALIHPDDMDRVMQFRRGFLSGQMPELHVTFRVRHAQGHWVWLYGSAFIVSRNEAGRPTLVRGIYLDVTSVELAREQAEAANRVKTEFLSRMSHELRSPLNSIMGYAQLLRMEGMNARQEDHLSNVLSGAQHMLKLVNDLLHITKNQPALAPLLKPTSLSALVSAGFKMIAPQAHERGITLSHDLSAGFWVQADPLRLQQVLINLLSNAVKYSHEGSEVQVTSSVLGNGLLRIAVRDQGTGIAAEVGEQVFEPFYRGTQAEFGFEGAGIGLTVCKQLVEAMRGRISYQSVLGVGSVFQVDLPPASADTAEPIKLG
jgi:signal transduction histidine kinase